MDTFSTSLEIVLGPKLEADAAYPKFPPLSICPEDLSLAEELSLRFGLRI